MSTIRRLYFYGLALISAEVIIWGVVGLLRTVVSGSLIGGGSLLATGLSLVVVGLPIFAIHWRTVQADAQNEPAERASRIRAVFQYGILLAILYPMVYAVLAVLNRGLVYTLGQPESSAWFGSGQTFLDNGIAILINAVALAYFIRILRYDWQLDIPENQLLDTRRLFRYIWVLSGLVLVISGAYNLVRFLLDLASGSVIFPSTVPVLAGAIALLLVGVPVWVYFWRTVQQSLRDPQERRSLLRLVVLYLISLAGVVGVLTFAGSVFNSLVQWLIGEQQSFADFVGGNSAQIGALIPLAVMWAYYGRILNQELASLTDLPRKAALRRLYYYILSLLGLAVTLAGLFSLVEFLSLILTSLGRSIGDFRSQFSGALSALLVGMPLWVYSWRKMQSEADRTDEAGDHARRSVLRKAYLYLVLFGLVIGVMVFAGQLIYSLLNAAFSGSPETDLLQRTIYLLLSLVIVAVFLVYHLRALRKDNRMASQSLGNLHANFPTLVFTSENASFSQAFGEAFVESVGQLAPRLPVKVIPVERGAPDELMLGAKAVLVPVGLALNPPEPVRLWLSEYHGQRILVPEPAEEWVWLGQPAAKTPQIIAREAAQTVRQMAEGETLRQSLPGSPWSVAGYILGGIFGLMLLSLLFSLMMTALFR